MTRSTIAMLCACALLAGCSLVLDPGRFQSGTEGDASVDTDGGSLDAGRADGGTDDDAGASDAGASDADVRDGGESDAGSCAGGRTCAPTAPLGWEGPIVLVTGAGAEAAPSCPADAPSTAFATRSGPSAAAAECGCTCMAPLPGQMSCSATTTLRTSSNCIIVGVAHATLTNGACTAISSLPSSGGWTAVRPTFSSSGSCSPTAAVDLDPVVWASSHRGCGFGAPVSCGESSVCVPPRAAGSRLCVYVDGEASCPGAFTELLETAESTMEGRGCTSCACGAVTGSCNGNIDITSGCTSFPTLHERIPLGTCTPARSISGTHHAGVSYAPSGSCAPSAVSPTGDVTPTGVRTVCCLPE